MPHPAPFRSDLGLLLLGIVVLVESFALAQTSVAEPKFHETATDDYSVSSTSVRQDAKIALHISSRSAKGQCSDNAPTLPCSQYVTDGSLFTTYDVYVVVANADDAQGLLGLEFGVSYFGAPGSGVDIFSWTSCADLEFPGTSWPGAHSDNLLTWSNCQNGTVPGFPEEGVHTVAGSFYVYAYSSDAVSIVPKSVESGSVVVASCDGGQKTVPNNQLGRAAFDTASGGGCNPCTDECAACSTPPESIEFGPVVTGSTLEQDVEILNTSDFVVNGPVSLALNNCEAFEILSGGGFQSIQPGDTLNVSVRFAPTMVQREQCELRTPCGYTVTLSGDGVFRVGECAAVQTSLEFGNVVVGDSRTLNLQVDNLESFPLDLIVVGCPEFYTTSSMIQLPPLGTGSIEITFSPSQIGQFGCAIQIRGGCDFQVSVSGAGVAPPGECSVQPGTVNFGQVEIGSQSNQVITLSNTTNQPVSGAVGLHCEGFEIVSGGGAYTLQPSETRDILVRFAPIVTGSTSCFLVTSCGSARLEATGVFPDSGPAGPKMALHLQTRTVKGQCTANSPNVPCSQYETEGQISTSYDLFLVAANVNPAKGLKGMEFAVQYNSALGVMGWTSCSDLEFPGLGWPASNGGNVLTWQFCQGDVIPGSESEGAFVVGGALYVYAYDGAALSIVPRLTQEGLVSVADCNVVQTAIPAEHRGRASFGATANGCNPCADNCRPCSFSDQELDFGPVEVGTSVVQTVTVTNTLPTLVTGAVEFVSGPGSDFSILNGEISLFLQPNATHDVVVQYAPSSEFLHRATILIGNCGLVSLEGQGVQSSQVCLVTPSLLDFGSAQVGSVSTRFLTFTNDGPEEISINLPVSLCDSQFTWDPTSPLLLTPGESESLAVQFSPVAEELVACSTSFSGGCNPVSLRGVGELPAVPVKLLSLTGEREDSSIHMSWKVADDPGLGQGVFARRGSEVRQISSWLFGENGTYEFVLIDPPAEAVTYWIGANERDGELVWLGSVDVPSSSLIQRPLSVLQNRPNPFSSSTRLSFITTSEGYADIRVFDMNGREVAKPFAQWVASGTHLVAWDGRDSRGKELSSGLYLYRVRHAGESVTKKMLLVRD